MSSPVVFPAPPPTSNTLTLQQRAKLLRTTRKLGRILGSTPHLLDAADSRSAALLPFRDEPYPTQMGRESFDSIGSSSSSSFMSRSPSTSRSTSPVSFSSSATSVRSMKSTASSQRSNHRSRPSSKRPPLLRISYNPHQPSLATIPASPVSPTPIYARFTSSFADLSENDASRLYQMEVNAITAPGLDGGNARDSLIEPDFFIPSQTTLRRQKMERLRRKLGDDVPIDLVFNQAYEAEVDDPSEISIQLPKSRSSPPPPPPTPASPSIAGIKRSGSRDSLALPTVHRAPRCKRVPVPAYEPEAPASSPKDATPPPHTPPVQCLPRAHRRPSVAERKESLCIIVESPDEHGGGCTEEFGLADALLAKYTTSTTNHPYASSGSPYVTDSAMVPMSTKGVSVKLFSTRRGYEGWARP
ncbi:hypothetical protein HGRIS_014329 [Hohenbuehelia grisea]|uniref:Uncharacterized protein n=1 Tax=Hohenbuehelia grisea TaxID=104357 RepID=A0ABR3JU29_9AGAR